MGLQHQRLDGEEYTAIIDEFMEAVYTRWPRVIVQFEDFQNKWAFKLLQRYRNVYRVFNDDVQVSPYLVALVCWMLYMMIL
jgi:malate dehydrogenase (decarboxylating)